MIALRLSFLVVVAALAAPAQAQRTEPGWSSSLQPSPDEAARPPAADTLRYSVRAGEVLIVGLPGRAAGAEVRYEVDQAPALSWLVDRSFYWRTLAQERGTLPVRLRRLAPGREADLVVLLVEILP